MMSSFSKYWCGELLVPQVAEARLSDFRAQSPPRARYMLELLEGEAGCWAKGNLQRVLWF